MKFSELWLREWVNPQLTREQLSDRLTMSGLEVEALSPVAEQFSGIVVGKVLSIEKHPEADRLQICSVDIGHQKLSIVCGAKNVKVGMKVPVAIEGSILPNKTKIICSDIRGVHSQGMLCSAVELGIAEQGEGLLQLSHDAPLGETIWDYLKLADYIMDVGITPNRGDCMSLMGMAKEISALTHSALHTPNIPKIKPSIPDILPELLQMPVDCPRYVGRIIRGIKADVTTPMWMQERLRRSGVRSIHPVVDVTNYVMLELGQPMHAFDLNKISQGIIVRKAEANEELKLLDGQVVKLAEDTLIIADHDNPLAIAGVMGGVDSSVTLLTQDIFLESAYFQPKSISRTSRRYNLGSESSTRFERGIDPTLQVIALERATELLLEIVGGNPGPINEVSEPHYLPQAVSLFLRKERIVKILGLTIPDSQIETILKNLNFSIETTAEGWQVTVPARRGDISLEIDLIEEIARLYGYDKLPQHMSKSTLRIHDIPETKLYLTTLRKAFRDLGYNEVITYSFIDKKSQKRFDPNLIPKELVNPITAEMSVMRTNLWPGLVNTLIYNQNRQQSRIRLFEIGLRFILNKGTLKQQNVVSGLINGTLFPEQWGIASREVDFFDLKGDLQNIFKLTLSAKEFNFKPSTHPALHPGQTAEIYRKDELVGIMGTLHPSIIQELDILGNVFVFELLLEPIDIARLPHAEEISKFPEIRRDIAILVDRTVPVDIIQDTIRTVAGDLLKGINLFDVYQGKGIAPNRKSIALALTLQHESRTLRDEEVADLIERVIVALRNQFAAELRS